MEQLHVNANIKNKVHSDTDVEPQVGGWEQPTFTKRQRGVTLIEIVVYMAIALIFIALAGGRIFDAFSAQGAQTETDNVISLISATKETRGRAGYGATDDNLIVTLVALERVPNALAVNAEGDSILNSWDGAVTVNPVGTAGALNQFKITYAKVPDSACIRMVQRISETGLVLNTTATVGGETPGIITSVDAAEMCKSTTDENTITWIVKG